jgi:hypothetical protein
VAVGQGSDLRDGFCFPGRWLGATSMLLGPTLLLTGVLLRIRVHFFFPQQLAAFAEHPALMTASYSFFLAGNILMWPAIVTLANLVGTTRPGWATWGGSLVVFGLFARTFHAGADHLAFQIVRVEDPSFAAKIVSSSYGAFHVVSSLNATILFGWIVLAIGAYLSGTLGLLRSIALGVMAGLMMGVLKGSSWMSVLCVVCLCVAVIPTGVQVLRAPPTPSRRRLLAWCGLLALLVAGLFVVGQLG